MNVTVLIPSLNPDQTLPDVVEALQARGVSDIVLINDGSRADTLPIFEALQAKGCVVLHHAVNLGKGRALKTGFNYILANRPHSKGVVTCDSDGQHETDAIIATAQALLAHPEAMILAVRRFFQARVPILNLMGNTITRFVFYMLSGLRFGDTQCGLRGFPMGLLAGLMCIPGERFEYENTMLVELRRTGRGYVELPIRAVYPSSGGVSHFRKLQDSARIYAYLLQAVATPVAAGLLSIALFLLLHTGVGLLGLLAALCALAGGWVVLLLSARPARRGAMLLAGIGQWLLYAALLYALERLGLTATAAWFILLLPGAALGYNLYLRAQYGPRSRRIVLTHDPV